MQDIDYQLQIYRVEFSKENELAFVQKQEPEVNELFKDLKKIEYDCNNAIGPLENRVKKAQADLNRAHEAEQKAYEAYSVQLEKERKAKENYEKQLKKADENISKSKYEGNISKSVKYLSKADAALYSAESYKREVINGNSDILYKKWQQRISEVKEAEDVLEDKKNKLKHVKMAIEYLERCDYEKTHYYAALSEHEFHSKRLESFQCIINSYRELLKNDANIEGKEETEKEILSEVELITELSRKQYIYLVKEEIAAKEMKSENGCKEGWRALANRFCVIKQDDRANPRLKRPVMIKMAEYLLEDAEDQNRRSKSEEPDIGEERIESIGVSGYDINYNYHQNLANKRVDIISQVDDFFKYAKQNMEKYPQKIEDIINKVSDVLNSKSVKYEKIEKLFNSTMEAFEKENGKIDEFIKDEEKHPINNYMNILQNFIYLIETEYYSPINANIENTVIDPLCFGLKRYQEIRELDTQIQRKYDTLLGKEIIDLECNLLPMYKHKQQLILEGYRNECLSIYPLLLNIMKTCVPDNPFNEISVKTKNEITKSNERLDYLKNQLNDLISKGKVFETQLFKYRDEIQQHISHCNRYKEDKYYGHLIYQCQLTINEINIHINYDRETITNINIMIKSIDLSKELINSPSGSKQVCLMQDKLLDIPPLPLEEAESESKSKSIRRNKSAKVAPIPTTMIVIKSKSRLTVEESKKEIELPVCESTKSIKEDDKTSKPDEELTSVEVITTPTTNAEETTTGETKDSNVDDNNIPDSIPDVPQLETNIPMPDKEKKEEKVEVKKEESNIIVEVSNAESMYRIVKNLLLWKYEILRLYHPSPIQILYSDIIKESNSHYTFQDYVIYNTKYHNDYDRLKYGKHGNLNWKLYRNIKKQLNNMKSKYKFIFLNIPEEMEFVQKFHYALSQFCNTCQTDCELIIKNYNTYYKQYWDMINKLPFYRKKVEDMKQFNQLDENIKKNLLGKGLKSFFSCCIPGICISYPYAGKKWCDEKVKNEELCRNEIN